MEGSGEAINVNDSGFFELSMMCGFRGRCPSNLPGATVVRDESTCYMGRTLNIQPVRGSLIDRNAILNG
eukprot:152763-Pelagomonas_calceolata.AAC.3